MHNKKALIKAHAFSKPPLFEGNEYSLGQRSDHLLVNIETITRALFYQSIKKAPRSYMHDFWILCLIWTCDATCITFLVYQAI